MEQQEARKINQYTQYPKQNSRTLLTDVQRLGRIKIDMRKLTEGKKKKTPHPYYYCSVRFAVERDLVLLRRVGQGKVRSPSDTNQRHKRLWGISNACTVTVTRGMWTYDLELDRNNSEIEDLDSRPESKVGFKGWQVDILKFASQGPSTPALSDGHEWEEAHQT